LHVFAIVMMTTTTAMTTMMKYSTRKTETNGSNIWWCQMRFKVGTF